MTTATKTVNNTELTTLDLDFNSRVYVQRVIYSYIQNNNLTEMQTFTYNQLIDLFQDATIWISANERAVVSMLLANETLRKDITDVQRQNVVRVALTVGGAN